MKGLVKLTPESLISLVEDCREYIENYDIDQHRYEVEVFSWLKLRKVKETHIGGPFWYQYRKSLQSHFYKLYKMHLQASKFDDEIWISELSYAHMVLLKDGNPEANPIYIMDY